MFYSSEFTFFLFLNNWLSFSALTDDALDTVAVNEAPSVITVEGINFWIKIDKFLFLKDLFDQDCRKQSHDIEEWISYGMTTQTFD